MAENITVVVDAFLVICGILSIPFAFVYLTYTFLLAWLPEHQPRGKSFRKTAQEAPGWVYVFMLPCLNEGKVVGKTIEGLLHLASSNCVVLIIDDDSDDDTACIVRSFDDPRVRLVQRKRPDARQGKGAALNEGFRWVNRAASLLGLSPDRVIVGVIDGDGRPTPYMLDDVAAAFAVSSVGAAQARVRITNRERLLPLMQDLEFATVVSAMQNSREYFGCVGLGGNGQVTRLSALRSLGPNPWTGCLLEDFDLGLRLLLAGWETRFLSESSVYQQGLTSPRRFVRQRARWAQGNMQCARYWRDILRSRLPWRAKLDLYYFLSQPWMHMVGTMLFIGWLLGITVALSSQGTSMPVALLENPVTWAVTGVLWLLLVFLPGVVWGLIHYRRHDQERMRRCLLAGILVPAYNLFVLPSVWLALWNHVTGKRGWAKTERLSESGPYHAARIQMPNQART